MNKVLIFAGIVVVVISKAIVIKSMIFDLPGYQKCLSDAPIRLAHTCGTDPFLYFILGWFITVGGFILVVFGLKMPATRSISR